MKKRLSLIAVVVSLFVVATSQGQDPVITSFHGNGQLSWTNTVDSNQLYRVEWAAQAGGPWYRTFDNLGSLDGLSATGFSVTVPMFYRVVKTTNPPPSGMVWIETGDVELGLEGFITPVHTNFIDGFWMDESEVTIDQWNQVYSWAITNGYAFENAGQARTNGHPVRNINWFDCAKWCNARSSREGLTPNYWFVSNSFLLVYQSGRQSNLVWQSNGYRLPTEAEWEKAARGGRQRRLFPWGRDTISHANANYFAFPPGTLSYDLGPSAGPDPIYGGAIGDTSPVGAFPANGFGLHDMAGNVREWCWDWYGTYSSAYDINPKGATNGTLRVVRGGDFSSYGLSSYGAPRCRNAHRAALSPDTAEGTTGFRCVRAP